MNTLREAAQQALEALGLWATGRDMDAVALNDLIFRFEEALAQPQTDPMDEYRKGFIAGQIDMRDREQEEPVQEPVATMTVREDMGVDFKFSHAHTLQTGQKFYLYTVPPQRLPLTDDKLDDIVVAARRGNLYDLRIAIEQARGIKGNT